jgi:hypothetical protein
VCNWSKSASSSVADLQLHYNSAPLAKAFEVGLDKNVLPTASSGSTSARARY